MIVLMVRGNEYVRFQVTGYLVTVTTSAGTREELGGRQARERIVGLRNAGWVDA